MKYDDEIDPGYDVDDYTNEELKKIKRLLRWWSPAHIAFCCIITVFALLMTLVLRVPG